MDSSTEEISLPNYDLVSRRDRSTQENRGGIITFARCDFARNFVHVSTSTGGEREWFIMHLDVGAIGLAHWHRPPDESVEKIYGLEEEINQIQNDTIGMFVI